MAISSINFQKTKANSYYHNFRKNENEPKYLLKEADRQKNEFWSCGKSDREIYDEQRKIYDEAKKNQKGRRPHFKNCCWEAVINLNKNHTLNDVKKVAKHIENKFNIICTSAVIHRDEGHYNNDNKPVYNYHAHINFVTLKDKKQNWTQSKTRPHLSDLQTEVAEILKMERGISKQITGVERLEHKAYRQTKQKEQELKKELENERVTKEQIKAEFEKLRQESKGQGFTKEFFKSLSEAKKEALKEIKDRYELEQSLQTFKKKYFFIEKIDYKAISENQEVLIKEQENQIKELQKIIKDQDKSSENLIKLKTDEIKTKVQKETREHFQKILDDKSMELEQHYNSKINKFENEKKQMIKTLETNRVINSLANQLKTAEDEKQEYIKKAERAIQNANSEIQKANNLLFIKQEQINLLQKNEIQNEKIKKENEKLKAENSRLKKLLEKAKSIIKKLFKIKNKRLQPTKKKSEFEVALNQYQNNETNTYDSFKDFKKAMEEINTKRDEFNKLFENEKPKDQEKKKIFKINKTIKKRDKNKDQGFSR